MLTNNQIQLFHTFGFLVLRQLFLADEIATMKREADDIMAEARQGKPFDPAQLEQVQPFFERRPFLSQLVNDDRVYALGEGLVGPDFLLDGTEGNYYVGDTPWHGSVGQYTLLQEIKIVFYLDTLTRENGALRVIPGSHLPVDPDHMTELRSRNKDPDFRPFGLHPHKIPSVAIDTEPGDVVIFTEDLIHGAFGGTKRRHLAVSFFKRPQTEEEHAFLRQQYEQARFSFHPSESYVNSDHPRVRRMVGPLVELGFEPGKI